MTDIDNENNDTGTKGVDILEYLKDNLSNVPVEVGKPEKKKLTNNEKANIVGKDAIEQAIQLEQPTHSPSKSDWVQQEKGLSTCLVMLKYRNQLIPIKGRETKIRVKSLQDGILVLRKLGQDLIDGKLDDLMNKAKERKRRTSRAKSG